MLKDPKNILRSTAAHYITICHRACSLIKHYIMWHVQQEVTTRVNLTKFQYVLKSLSASTNCASLTFSNISTFFESVCNIRISFYEFSLFALFAANQTRQNTVRRYVTHVNTAWVVSHAAQYSQIPNPNSFSARCAFSKRGCVIELAPWDFATECISGGFHPTFVIHSVICITFFLLDFSTSPLHIFFPFSSCYSFITRCVLSERGCVIELAPWDFATEFISGGFHPTFMIHSIICITFFNFTHSQFGFRSVLASKGK